MIYDVILDPFVILQGVLLFLDLGICFFKEVKSCLPILDIWWKESEAILEFDSLKPCDKNILPTLPPARDTRSEDVKVAEMPASSMSVEAFTPLLGYPLKLKDIPPQKKN